MTISFKGNITWRGNRYYGADRLGFTDKGQFVVSLFTYREPHDQRGNYFTVIPISGDEYRATDKTKAAVRDDGDALTVFCDWGDAHRIEMPRSAVESLIAEAVSHGIPVTPNVGGEAHAHEQN